MLNELIHKIKPTARVLHTRGDYTSILIPPILYHGTNSNYLRENIQGGFYTKPTDVPIFTVADSLGAIQVAKDEARYYPQQQPSIPKLLVIDTLAEAQYIAKDRKNTPQMVLFDRLQEDGYEALDLIVPEGEDFYHLKKILEINRENIEVAIQRLLGLRSRVSMESIHPQDLSFKGWHSATSD